MMTEIISRLLLKCAPETAHHIALQLLSLQGKFYHPQPIESNPIKLMGLQFPNRVGIAAGFDKNAEVIDGLASLGFGHIEVGTITPRPQSGNPRPRLFRLIKQQAIINRMGFNNAGVTAAIENIARTKYKGILGINIGKNADTPIDKAADDYLYCLRKVYPYASYITINISSPNTANLRSLQLGEQLDKLLEALKNSQQKLAAQYQKYVPLVVKIAPDLSDEEIASIAKTLLTHKFDGVIATNTTQSRNLITSEPLAKEAGGLSGAPLTQLSTHVIKVLAQHLQGAIPIIASGGIMTAADAAEKLRAGASLVQIYTGFVYHGPKLIEEINRNCVKLLK